MIQIIPEKRKPSFGEQLMTGLGKAAQEGSVAIPKMMGERLRNEKENEFFKKNYGIELAGMAPNTRQEFTKSFAKSSAEAPFKEKLMQMRMKKEKAEEDHERFTLALDHLKRMREIVEKRNIGRGSSIIGFFPGETARDRSEYAQLGTSLIPLVAAGVPIRNQREFDQYRKVITDPSASISDMIGAINGLERIFNNKLQGVSSESVEKEEKKDFGKKQETEEGEEEQKNEQKKEKIKFNPKNKMHVKRFNKIKEKNKNDKNKINIEMAKEFEL